MSMKSDRTEYECFRISRAQSAEKFAVSQKLNSGFYACIKKPEFEARKTLQTEDFQWSKLTKAVSQPYLSS